MNVENQNLSVDRGIKTMRINSYFGVFFNRYQAVGGGRCHLGLATNILKKHRDNAPKKLRRSCRYRYIYAVNTLAKQTHHLAKIPLECRMVSTKNYGMQYLRHCSLINFLTATGVRAKLDYNGVNFSR